MKYQVGDRIGKLTLKKHTFVETPSPSEPHRRRGAWICKCDCGNSITLIQKYLSSKRDCGSCTRMKCYHINSHDYLNKLGKEKWKNSIYDSYQVSSWGRIRKIQRNGLILYLSPESDKNGYLKVSISNSKLGIHTTVYVHRLVALAFLNDSINTSNKIINHKDEIKYHNYVSNLEWCDYRYNMIYGSKRLKSTKTRVSNKNTARVYAFKDGILIYSKTSSWIAKILRSNSASIIDSLKTGMKLRGWGIGYSLNDAISRSIKEKYIVKRNGFNKPSIAYTMSDAMGLLNIHSYTVFHKVLAQVYNSNIPLKKEKCKLVPQKIIVISKKNKGSIQDV